MNEKYLLGFALLPDIGPVRFEKIKHNFPSLETAWQSTQNTEFIRAGFSPKMANQLIEHKNRIDLEKYQRLLARDQIAVIGKDDPLYPAQLKEIFHAPFALFCRGNLDLLKQNQIAVVGTRRPSLYGLQVTEKIVPQLVRDGLVVTSGLAQGIDSLAHQNTLNKQGRTIAVLGSAVDDDVLKQNPNCSLAWDILDKNGLILSEYPPLFLANKNTFPARNRIISGLSLGTLVIEAGQKSGALITANYALEQNREVFAIPGSIFSSQSIGSNQLIKKGAKPVLSIEDILETFNLMLRPAPVPDQLTFDDPLEEKIFQQLSFEPVHINQIAIKLKLDIPKISTKLSLMELKNLAKSSGSGKFIRCQPF